MNKIFKVIWNHATQTWVAVSETTKAKGKSKSSSVKKISLAAISVAGAVASLLGGSAQAQDAILLTDKETITIGKDSFANTSNSISIGHGAKSESSAAVAIGRGAVSGPTAFQGSGGGKVITGDSQSTVAIGLNANATGSAATAVGANSIAPQNFATAFGNSANASTVGSTAIGQGAVASGDNGYGTALGQNAKATGTSSNALGRLSQASGYYATAVGAHTLGSGTASIAIGGGSSSAYGAKATAQNSIAIGEGANSSASLSMALGKGTTSSGERAIAVGPSANALGSRTISMGSEANVAKVSDAIGIGTKSNVGSSDAIAIGKNANGSGHSGVAIGAEAKVSAANTVALGIGANVSAQNALALGANSSATHAKAVALGWNATTESATNTNSATVNGISYAGFAGNSATASVSLGNSVEKRTLTNLAAGRVTESSTDAINGSQLYIVANRLSQTTAIKSEPAGNVSLPQGANGTYFVNGTTVISAINGTGWNIKGQGTQKGLVKPANSVDFVDGTATTAEVGGSNGAYSVKYNVNAGKGLHIDGNKLVANVSEVKAGNGNISVSNQDGVVTISATDTNTQASVEAAANRPIKVTPSPNSNGTQKYTIDVETGAGLKVENGKLVANGTTINAGKNITLSGDPNTGYTINANNTVVTAEDNTVVVTPEISGSTTTYKVKGNYVAGKGVTITGNSISANISDLQSGGNVTVTNKGNGVYEIAAKNTQASVEAAANSPISITSDTPNANGTQKYVVNVSTGAGLKVEGGKLVANGTTITAGDNINVTGDVHKGYTISVPTTTLSPNNNGKIDLPAGENAKKFVNATEIVNAINNASFSTAVGRDSKDFTDQTSSGNTSIKAGDTLTFKSGKNLKVKQDGTNFTYATEDNVTFSKVNATTLVLGDKTNSTTLTSTADGLNVGGDKITNLADGDISKNSKDAVNGGQLYATNQNLTNLTSKVDGGLNFQGNKGAVINKPLGKTLKILGALSNETSASAQNIRIDNDNGNLTVKFAETPEFTGITLKSGSNTVNLTAHNGGLHIAKADGSNATLSGVANGTLSKNSTDAVNGSQLYATNNNITNIKNAVAKGWNIMTGNVTGSNGVATNSTLTNVSMGETVTVNAGNNIEITQNGKTLNISTSATPSFTNITTNEVIVGKAGKDGAAGVDGKIGVNGQNGTSVVLNGKDGSIGLTGKAGADGKHASTNLTVANGTTTLSDRDNGNNITRITYTDKDKDGNPITREIATLDDGLKFKGDNDTVINRTLGSQLNIVGGAKEANLTANNIGVVGNANGTLTVKLNKDLNLTEKGSVVIGNTTLNDNGLTIKDGPSVTQSGINAGDKKITHVGAGDLSKDSTDAVNGSQLYATNNNITNIKNAVAKGWNVTIGKVAGSNGVATNNTLTNVAMGDTLTVSAGNNIEITQKGKTLEIATSATPHFTNITTNEVIVGKTGENGKPGVDGKIGVNGKDGTSVVLNGKDGSIGLTGKAGADGKHASTNLTVANGTTTLSDRDGGNNITRITYTDKDKDGNPITREIATLDDGLKFKGNKGETINKKLGETLEVVGELADNAEASAKNVRVDNEKGKLTVKLANQVDLGSNGSITMGNVSVNHHGINAGNTTIANVKDGDISPTSKDAINGSQLYNATKDINNTVAKGWNVQTQAVAGSNGVVNNSTKTNVAMGDTVNIQAGNNIEITQNGKDIAIATSSTANFTHITTNEVTVGKAGKDGQDGVDGKVSINGKDGASVVINGKDGSIGLTGAKGADGKDGASASLKVENGTKGLDGNDGQDGESKTRIVYEKPNGEKETLATLNDGLTFAGDSGTESKRKLGEKVTVRGGQTDTNQLSHKPNLGVISDGNGNLDVKLAKNLDLEKDGSLTIGNTTVNNEGITIKGGTSITSNGINAGNKVISNVAPGVKNTDAVNVAQLKGAVSNVNNHINKLDKRIRGVGANAAAAASLPQVTLAGKSMLAASGGGYNGASAIAVGYSRASDNGKVILKVTGTANSTGQYSGGVGVGYQW